MTTPSKVEYVRGRAIPLRGNDIDTDRIIPARYLKTITFDGLDQHVFEDDRQQLAERGQTHAFDVKTYEGATLLFVQANFGCGSSREHAPQAIARWGIKAIIGESFAEIFFGNSLIMGLPCVTVDRADIERLIKLAETHPETQFELDLHTCKITSSTLSVTAKLSEATRAALLSGNWDATGLLLDGYDEVDAVAAQLPYVSGWK